MAPAVAPLGRSGARPERRLGVPRVQEAAASLHARGVLAVRSGDRARGRWCLARHGGGDTRRPGGAATRAGVRVSRLRDRRRASGLGRPSGAVWERHEDEEAGLVDQCWRRRRNPCWSREHGPGDAISCLGGAGHRWGVVAACSGAMAVSRGAEATSRAAASSLVTLSSDSAETVQCQPRAAKRRRRPSSRMRQRKKLTRPGILTVGEALGRARADNVFKRKVNLY